MKALVYIFFLINFLSYGQIRDYKSYDKAVEYNRKGNFEKAIRFANRSLNNSPNWSKPNLLLASIYANNDDIKVAAGYLLKVYSLDNLEDALGINQIAKLYYSNGYYKDALYFFEQSQNYLANKDSLLIENCKFSIKVIKNPIQFNTIHLDDLINTSMTEYVNTVSADGKKLFLTRRVESDQSRDQEDIFIYDIEKDYIAPSPFNTSQNEGAITVSSDGTMCVYTACDRENTIGGCDLYIRKYSEEFGWSAEYNLGPNVNSSFWESQSCFSSDGNYLYFISNRTGGYGKEDIWRSKITSDGFLPAQNLGGQINTQNSELSPFLHADNITLYFASNGHVGLGEDDLFVSRRDNALQDWGKPYNLGYPINTHKSENSLIVSRNGKTAYYTSDVIGFGKEDIFRFDLPDYLSANPVDDLELDIITNKTGSEVILKNVSFNSNSFDLISSSYSELNKLVVYLNKNPQLKIEIQGHTDNIGSDSDNMLLSQRRSKIVFDYLTKKVVNTLTYKGFGESRPIVSNTSSKNRMINRRTSFVILNL